MIELSNVTIRAGQCLLERVSFRIESGSYAVLMGRTGLGKTTILESICGLRSIVSGSVIIQGTDVSAWSPAERQIGYVPQDLALFPTFTVKQHLEFALRLRKVAAPVITERVAELSTVLGITSLLNRRIQGLSGGERQRVALGRALSFRPGVLLLDEPLSALDEETRQEMLTLLRHVKETTAVTTLHVTHNQDDAEALADHRLVLDKGKVTRIE